MIIILTKEEAAGKAPKDHLDFMGLFSDQPRLVAASCDASHVYIEGHGFVKDRFAQGVEPLRAVLAELQARLAAQPEQQHSAAA